VVRAETENEARSLASAEGGDEVRDNAGRRGGNPWLDPKQSTCETLTADGAAGVVIRDFASA